MPRVGATGNLDSSCARRRERSADRDEETGRSDRTKKLTKKNAAPCQISLTKKVPYKGPGADSEEKREPVSDIDIAAADSLIVLDLKRPIREATKVASGKL